MELNNSVVAILDDHHTIGTGFVISERHIATCFHVINNLQGAKLTLFFPEFKIAIATAIDLERFSEAEDDDIAIIEIPEPLPTGVEPLLLGSSGGTSGHKFKALGFPEPSLKEGLWAYGTIGDEIKLDGHPRLQLTNTTEITAGYSGGPILDLETKRVVGMVVSITAPDVHGRLNQTAFAIPSESLIGACPELVLSDICPYKGLAAFEEEDTEFFFGRKQLVSHMEAQLLGSPHFLAVVGPSGSGKTSLIQSGLFPSLREGKVFGDTQLHIVSIRPGTNPYASLEEVGVIHSLDRTLKLAVEEALQSDPTTGRLVLFIDQFEELFLYGSNAVRERFLEELTELLDLSLTLIIAIRADYYEHLLKTKLGTEWLSLGQVNVYPVSSTELREIIEKPAQEVGLHMEPGLVSVIADDAWQVEHQLPLLETSLAKVWGLRKDGLLTHEAYQNIGRVAGAVSLWAEDSFNRLGSTKRSTARHIITRLIFYSPEANKDTRQWQTLRHLVTPTHNEDDVRQVVKELADSRLLVTEKHPLHVDERIELIHDSLLVTWNRLQQWRTEDREFLQWRQELQIAVKEWEHNERDKGYLLRAAPLKNAKVWYSKRTDRLNSIEADFINESFLQHKRQISRILMVVTVTAIVVFSVVLLLRKINSAETLAREAQAAFSSGTEDQLHLAGLLAIESSNVFPNSSSEELLAQLPYFISSSGSILSTYHSDVTDVAWSPGGPIASAEVDGFIYVWDTESHSLIQTLRRPIAIGPIHLAWSSTGQLASGSYDTRVIVWDVEAGAPSKNLVHHTAPVTSVAWSQDGRLASASHDIAIWDVNESEPLNVLNWDSSTIRALAWSPDGRLASGGDSGTIIIWNVNTGEPELFLEGHGSPVSELAWSPDGELASASVDHYAALWDLQTQKPTRVFEHASSVLALGWSSTGYLATGEENGTLTIWDRYSDQPFKVLEGHKERITSITWSPYDELVTGSSDNTVVAWDLSSGSTSQSLDISTTVSDIALSSDGLLAASSPEGAVVIKDIASEKIVWTWESIPINALNIRREFYSIAWSPQLTLTVGADHGDLILINPVKDDILADISPFDSRVNALAWSDNEFLAAGDLNGGVIVWDFGRRSSPAVAWYAHDDYVNSLAWSPAGLVASASGDTTVKIWEPTGEIIQVLEAHKGPVASVAWSDDGRLASGATTGETIVWDLETGKPSKILEAKGREVMEVSWSPSGLLASGFDDGSVVIWDRENAIPFQILKAHNKYITGIIWLPDGSLLSSAIDGTIRVLPEWLVNRQPCDWLMRNLTGDEWATYRSGLVFYKPTCPDKPTPTLPGTTLGIGWMDVIVLLLLFIVLIGCVWLVYKSWKFLRKLLAKRQSANGLNH